MKIIFAASAEIAVQCLEMLVKREKTELVGVLTNPDSVKGRAKEPTPTEIGAAAVKITRQQAATGGKAPVIFKPEALDSPFCEKIAALKPDLLVSFAYGKLFTPQFLSIFPKGGINIHPSLLPKYRGAAPVQAAILSRDTETGISIQQIVEKLDAGGIYARERIELKGDETTLSLTNTVSEAAPALLERVLQSFEAGSAAAKAQNDGEATWCRELKKEDGRIDWARSAVDIDAQIRAFDPWPLSFTTHGPNELYILSGRPGDEADATDSPPGTVLGVDKTRRGILIQTGDGVYCAQSLQYKTKKALDWKSFLNGARNFVGSLLVKREE
jgi:methionyl-tRNA formyltransferase